MSGSIYKCKGDVASAREIYSALVASHSCTDEHEATKPNNVITVTEKRLPPPGFDNWQAFKDWSNLPGNTKEGRVLYHHRTGMGITDYCYDVEFVELQLRLEMKDLTNVL